MALVECPECCSYVNDESTVCPRCGHPIKAITKSVLKPRKLLWGMEWKSKTTIMGWPLVHIAIGRSRETGRLLTAKGIIAIGQFGLGLITIAQFGLGIVGLGQFIGGIMTVGQFALGLYFAAGQVACGITAVGQAAVGKYILAQVGYGQYMWTSKIKQPEAVEYFQALWFALKNLFLIRV